jgi:hypothetical protein
MVRKLKEAFLSRVRYAAFRSNKSNLGKHIRCCQSRYHSRFLPGLTSILVGGIYSIVPLGEHAAYRFNKFTGSAELLFGRKAAPVEPVPELTPTAEPSNSN